MSDRELLELAAKAADIKVEWREWRTARKAEFGLIKHTKHEGFWIGGQQWDPLTDDGDALRLAVTLNIDIEFRESEVWAYRHAFADGECFTATERLADHRPEDCGTGCRATRCAIVRAAAEIGRAMP